MAIHSTFNPSAMSPELIEGILVQRHSLAQRLVEVFEESARRKTKHNVLLVGPRGIGKSHLVSLVYHRLRSKRTLSDKLVIAYLREDEWGINSFLDLLVRTLHAASEEQDESPRSTLGDLAGLTRAQAESRAWQSLQDVLGGRTLLLIIENLDAAFEKIGEIGQRQWRALMQTNPQWAILATTPALFSAVSRQVSPFYGFFEVTHLKPLSVDDAVGLLQKLARWNEDEELAGFLETPAGRARVRAVQHLAGGNHRVFVLFYDFLSQTSSENLVKPLIRTVDALTPYYQAQITKLSPQQQKIVNFLCEHRKPAIVKTIAKYCFASHQTTASQLKQLLAKRYLRVDRVGRESFYELTEPLMRICVEAKTHQQYPLHLLVDFIRYWYSREELEQRLSATATHDFERKYLSAALKDYNSPESHAHLNPEIASLCHALSMRTDTPECLQAKAQELAELSKIAEDWSHYARAMFSLNRASEVIPKLEAVLSENPTDVEALRSLAWAHANGGSIRRAHEVLDLAFKQSTRAVLFVDRGQLLMMEAKNKEAIDAFDLAAAKEPNLRIIIAPNKAAALMNMGQFKTVRDTLSPFISQGKRMPRIFRYFGIAFAEEEKFREALEFLDKATDAFEHDSDAWLAKGIVLCRMQEYEKALEILDRPLILNPPAQERLRHYRCEALIETRRFAEASKTATSDNLSHNIFHQLLKIVSSHPKQEQMQMRLLELKDADKSETWQSAFVGSIAELVNYATKVAPEANKDIQLWNSALHALFEGHDEFAIPLKYFDVLIRFRVLGDKKALLELPLEQRSLLLGEESGEAASPATKAETA